MQRQQRGRIAWIVPALLAAAGVLAWAQADTPIVILDGSLTIDSAVPWSQFTGGGDQRFHPHTNKTIRQVAVTMPAGNQTVDCSGAACTIDVMYAGTDIRIAGGGPGKGLSFSPFSAFQTASPTRLAHKNQNAKISHVTVTKGGDKVYDSAASGGTKVVISFQ